MTDERLWLTLGVGISPTLADPALQAEVDGEFRDEHPLLFAGLKKAMHAKLRAAGVDPASVTGDDGEEDGPDDPLPLDQLFGGNA